MEWIEFSLPAKGRVGKRRRAAAIKAIQRRDRVALGTFGDRPAIDLMLAHAPRGISASEYAYNRAKHGKRRRELAETWATMLCEGLEPPLALIRGQER